MNDVHHVAATALDSPVRREYLAVVHLALDVAPHDGGVLRLLSGPIVEAARLFSSMPDLATDAAARDPAATRTTITTSSTPPMNDVHENRL
jgi:hypothetical protein